MFARIVLLLSLQFSLSILASPLTGDSIIRSYQLSCKTKWEKKALHDVYVTNSSFTNLYLQLLWVNNKDTSLTDLNRFNERLTNFITSISQDVESAKNASRRIEYIHKKVHAEFLKKYELSNEFKDLVRNGSYNCVSGTALFALVLGKLNIPYAIKEYPTHVNLIAYPGNFNILIETTDPTKGYLKLSNELMNKYVDHLLKQKKISQTDYDQKPTEQIFNDYFFSSRGNLSLRELIGLQYVNNFIYTIEEKKALEAYQWIQKAYWLYPSEKTSFLIKESLEYLLPECDYSDSSHTNYLVEYIKSFNKTLLKSEKDKIVVEFIRILKKQLGDEANFEACEKSFKKIIANIDSSDLYNEIYFNYCYEKNRVILNLGAKRQPDLECLSMCYKKTPNNSDLQKLILWACTKMATKTTNAPEIYKNLLFYQRKFDFLAEHYDYVSAILLMQLETMYIYYNKGEAKSGDEVMNQTNNLLDKKIYIPEEQYIEKAYISAVAYYYKNNNLTKAKQIINKALNYIPENTSLLDLKNSLK